LSLKNQMKNEVPEPWFDTDQTDEGLIARFSGTWTSRTVGTIESHLHNHIELDFPKKHPVQIIIEKECIMDTAGACLIARIIKLLKRHKREVTLTNHSSSTLLDYFLNFQPPRNPIHEQNDWKLRFLNHLGYQAIIIGQTTLNMLNFLGEVVVTWLETVKSVKNIRWVSVFYHAQEVGLRAIPIVGLISFLIGMVLAYQSINQLQRFGAEIYTIDFLGVSILREIAVLLTAIVIAGRSGSAFTAQIGTMSLNQEIDAIRMMSLNPILVLVVPRIIAILICLPILVFFSMVIGLLGGMVITHVIIDVTFLQFLHQLQRAVSTTTFWVGMSKAPLFGILIGLVGCYRGFQVKGSAESVGRMTTQSVVESIFLVIICDAFMSILFSYLKV
jgi:phospholipid/cholesterol/gamma-HCH transport system permease protein